MKAFFLTAVALLFAGAACTQPLTKADRKAAIKYINWSGKELKKSLKGLTAEQLNWKPAEDRWSAQDCMYHIAFSEGALRGALDQALAAPADPAAKAALEVTDDQVKSMIVDRSNPVKTAQPFEPQNTGFKSLEEAKAAFKEKRAMLIDLVKKADPDMRNHIVTLPFGKLDAYQFVLFIAGHSNRHTLQIEEVKASPGYPVGK
ncbi:MAG TPA: DinB family protein [Flavilitoribacter sp.]|nr:DinB family protein [Flavilitoribacter sp.]